MATRKAKPKQNTCSVHTGKPPHQRISQPIECVGDLVEELKKYPPNLELVNEIVLVWFNLGSQSEKLGLEENDGTFEPKI